MIAVLKNAYNPAGASLPAEMDTLNPLESMPHVASRIARASYGTMFSFPARHVSPPIDSAKEKPYVDREGVKRVNRLRWYLKKVGWITLLTSPPVLITHHQGESVQDKAPVVHHFTNFFRPEGKTVWLTLYMSDADTPPAWLDESVQKLCRIQCEIDIPWEKMTEMRDREGKLLPSRRVDNLALSMSFEGAPKWTLEAGGQTTEQEAEVEYA